MTKPFDVSETRPITSPFWTNGHPIDRAVDLTVAAAQALGVIVPAGMRSFRPGRLLLSASAAAQLAETCHQRMAAGVGRRCLPALLEQLRKAAPSP